MAIHRVVFGVVLLLMFIFGCSSSPQLISPLEGNLKTGGRFSNRMEEITPSGSFLPIWKLLNPQEKQHFISGYLHGWREASKVTEVTIAFLRDNPQAKSGDLDKLRRLYELSHFKVPEVVKAVDYFYADPSHNSAPLSMALSSLR